MKVLDVGFSGIEFLVLDEADRMLDMGFLPDVQHIMNKIAKTASKSSLLSNHAERYS